MNRRKINDYFSFPTDLDMFPYSEDGIIDEEQKQRGVGSSSPISDDSQNVIPNGTDDATVDPDRLTTSDADAVIRLADGAVGGSTDVLPDSNTASASDYPEARRIRNRSYYTYKLTGIVAHCGAIDSGHYYSFIREESEYGDGSVWNEFNDRNVLPFKPDDIPRECFGGPELVQETPGGAGDSSGVNGAEKGATSGVSSRSSPSRPLPMRQYSAYMLVYQRDWKLEEQVASRESRATSASASAVATATTAAARHRALNACMTAVDAMGDIKPRFSALTVKDLNSF